MIGFPPGCFHPFYLSDQQSPGRRERQQEWRRLHRGGAARAADCACTTVKVGGGDTGVGGSFNVQEGIMYAFNHAPPPGSG